MINIVINGWTFHNVSIYYQRDLKRQFQTYIEHCQINKDQFKWTLKEVIT